MDIRALTDTLSVTPQIAVDDMPRIAAAGYRSIISNRPDDEENGQPSAAAIKASADAAGIAFVHIPVTAANITQADVTAFDKALETLPKPILGFCRTGTRATMLWALSRTGKEQPSAIIKRALAVGYDISALAERLSWVGRT